MGKTATIIGATGLIGNFLVEELLEETYFETVRILVRRPVEYTHPKLEKKIVDFTDTDSLLVALDGSDSVFCTIGTTNKKVKGDKEAYRKIDHDIPVRLARACKESGCRKFILVSSIGANSKSSNFYLRLKGEVEDAIKKIDIPSVHILQPSMLLGTRNESRPAEKLARLIMRATSVFIPASYRAIHAKDVARKMVTVAKVESVGIFVHKGNSLRS